MKFLIMLTALVSSLAHAQQSGKKTLANGSLVIGTGSFQNESESIPKTNMLFTELAVQGGYKFGVVAPVAQAAYRYVGQMTDAEEVNNINVGGMGYVGGAGLSFEFTSFSFQVIYNFLGEYTLHKESSGGSKVTYAKPTGFHAGFKYNLQGNLQLVFSASQIDYNERLTGDTDQDIEDDPFTQTLYGMGIGYRF